MFEKRTDKNDAARQGNVEKTPPRTAPTMSKAAVIGTGININGDISGTENLVIEGRVEGKIQLPGHQVEIGRSGRVSADISAKFVKIEGELRGDIDGKEKVFIAKAGNVKGNIKAPRVQLEDGAIFKGSIDIDPNESAPVELPLTNKPQTDNVQKLGSEGASKEPGFTIKGG